jgi:hypothetical protein
MLSIEVDRCVRYVRFVRFVRCGGHRANDSRAPRSTLGRCWDEW